MRYWTIFTPVTSLFLYQDSIPHKFFDLQTEIVNNLLLEAGIRGSAVLIFVSGIAEIEAMYDRLRSNKQIKLYVTPSLCVMSTTSLEVCYGSQCRFFISLLSPLDIMISFHNSPLIAQISNAL